MTYEESFRPALCPDLLQRRIGHEAIVWSPKRPHPAALDPVAAVLLDVIDGVATVSELISDVHEVVGVPRDVAGVQVARVLQVLEHAGAFATSEPVAVEERQRELFLNPPST